MPNYTPNYNLTKPLGTDLYDIEVHNGNMDKIDKNMSELRDKAINGRVIETTVTTDLNEYKTTDHLGNWFCGGTNLVVNKPYGVDSFGLVVMKTATGYVTQILTAGSKLTNKTFIRTHNANAWSSWEEIAFANGNVASATKLETARSINGVPFDGTADISIGCIGYEPITTTGADTVANWKALGSGYAVYTTTKLNEQPTDYGFVVQYVYNSLLYQEFHSMPSGGQWYRKGNNTGWWNDATNVGTWRKVYDEFNKPTPADIGAVKKSGDTMTGQLVAPNVKVKGAGGWPEFTLEMENSGVVGGLTSTSEGRMEFYTRKPGGTYSEWYMMPSNADDLTANKWYSILTSKSPVTIAQGGTGATDAATARTNLGAVSKSGDTMTGTYTTTGVISAGWSNARRAGIQSSDIQAYFTSRDENGTVKNALYLKDDSSVLTKALTVASGGTGATTSREAEYNICNDIKSATSSIEDSEMIVVKRSSGSASAANGAFATKTADKLWNYIKTKIEATYNVTKK